MGDDEKLLALHPRFDVETKFTRNKPCEIRLRRARIKKSVRSSTTQKGNGFVRHTGRLPCRAHADDRRFQITFNLKHHVAAARYGGNTDQQHVERELDEILADSRMRRVPCEIGLLTLHQPLRHIMGVAQIKLRAGRPRRTKGKTRKLKLGRGLCRTFGDKIHRVSTHFRIIVILEHFQPVGDGPDRADNVMADAAAQECGQFECRNVALHIAH